MCGLSRIKQGSSSQDSEMSAFVAPLVVGAFISVGGQCGQLGRDSANQFVRVEVAAPYACFSVLRMQSGILRKQLSGGLTGIAGA